MSYHATTNDARTTLAAAHVSGDGVIEVADASRLPATPYYLTVITAATAGTDDETKTIYDVTGASGTTLAVSVVSGETDRNYAIGSVAEVRVVAQLLTELQTGKADASHTHAAGDITSGTLDAARIPDLSATYSVTTHNHDLVYAPIASPTFTGTVTAPTIQGSAASGGNLTIRSTSHATKGAVIIDDGVVVSGKAITLANTDYGTGSYVPFQTRKTASTNGFRILIDTGLWPVFQVAGTDGSWKTALSINANEIVADMPLAQTVVRLSGVNPSARYSHRLESNPGGEQQVRLLADHTNSAPTWPVLVFQANTTVSDPSVRFFEIGSGIRPYASADSGTPNNTIYFSTTANKLVYKDVSGAVNNLY